LFFKIESFEDVDDLMKELEFEEDELNAEMETFEEFKTQEEVLEKIDEISTEIQTIDLNLHQLKKVS